MEFFLGAFSAEWEQRKAALLHDLSLGRRKPVDEEERRRRSAGSAPGGIAAGGARLKGTGVSRRSAVAFVSGRAQRGGAERPMRTRFAALASGSQPAVVKMASFGGGSRLGAMVSYVSRNGEVVVENERGEQLRGRDELVSVSTDWDHLMKNRAESRDIGLFRIKVVAPIEEGSDLNGLARAIVKRGFEDRSYVYAAPPRAFGNGFDVEGLVVLRSPSGERLTADGKAAKLVQARIEEGNGEGVEAHFRFAGYGNGVDYGTSRLRALVDKHNGAVRDEQGRVISDDTQAGDLVQQKWRHTLHSRKPRDVMHLIMSARAGTDVAAFEGAARDFLAAEFSGHRYVFAIHDPANDPKAEDSGGKRPHVHAHAIVVMRSDAGDRIETTIPAFRRWRVTMAEKARDHGINMEMTDRRERASAPAFGKNQARPINMTGRTEHEGTSEVAERRYHAKRSDDRSFVRTRASKAYTVLAGQEWRALATMTGEEAIATFATAQILRLETKEDRRDLRQGSAHPPENSPSQSRINLVLLTNLVSEGDDMRHMTRPEFEAYEKRVEMALFQAERVTHPSERADFEEIAAAAREHVNVRRELVELVEERDRGETVVKRPEDGHARAQDIQAKVQEPDDSRQRWHDAVTRHGLATVQAANQILVEIERAREDIERVEAGEADEQDVRAMKEELDIELRKAAVLGAAGNTLIREVAEVDDELRTTLITVERQRIEREKARGEGREILRSDERNDREQLEDRGSQGGGGAGRNQTGIRSNENDQSHDRDAERQRAAGDATRADPAKQRVPRLEKLQREADERERDQDDRER